MKELPKMPAGSTFLARPILGRAIVVLLLLVLAGIGWLLMERHVSGVGDGGMRREAVQPGAVLSSLPAEVVAGQTLYVPIYSHVYQIQGSRLPLFGDAVDSQHRRDSISRDQGRAVLRYSWSDGTRLPAAADRAPAARFDRLLHLGPRYQRRHRSELPSRVGRRRADSSAGSRSGLSRSTRRWHRRLRL